MSAAAWPAAPPPTMITDEGFCFDAGDGVDSLRELLAHEHLAVPLLDLPARDPIQRRRAKRFARLEAEARVMERAPNRLANDEAVGEMAAVVRAPRADDKEATAGFDDDLTIATSSSSFSALTTNA